MSNPKLQIKTKKLPESRLAIEFQVPAEQCKKSFEDALATLTGKIIPKSQSAESSHQFSGTFV